MAIIPRTRNRLSYCHLLCARTPSNSNFTSSLLQEVIMGCVYKINVHWSVGQLNFHVSKYLHGYTVCLKVSLEKLL